MLNYTIERSSLMKKILSLLTGVIVLVTGCSNVKNKENNSAKSIIDEEEISNSKINYSESLFGGDVIDINIVTEKSNWDEMLEDAKSEEYISVDIEVNGEIYKDVGIRAKGNSSLSMVNSEENNRYSFKIKFDKYVDGQNCQGLDKLVLNNCLSDNTYMKDYIAFDMMNFMEVNSSLYNYSYIKVNGEYWGTYIALEAYDESFLDRTYENTDGNLYNVKMNDMGNDMKGFERGQIPEEFEEGKIPEGEIPGEFEEGKIPEGEMPEGFEKGKISEGEMPEGFERGQIPEGELPEGFEKGETPKGFNRGKMGAANTGGALKYTDDNISSYSSIFDNAVFDKKTTDDDKKSVITAINKLSKGEELEKYFDVDQILRYFAVNAVLVNLDSYHSEMAQNYYLYENNGVVSILPWDYNLSFGGFGFAKESNASSIINFPIDTPVSQVSMEERPLISKLLEVDEYKEKYHSYLKKLVDEYINNGHYEKVIDGVNEKISEKVKTDPTAFCTFEEYNEAVSTLKQVIKLRGESIQGQLEGIIPATSEGQKEDSSKLINTSNIDISKMGTQGFGDDYNRFPGNFNNKKQITNIDVQ